jgi:hypothetical protein
MALKLEIKVYLAMIIALNRFNMEEVVSRFYLKEPGRFSRLTPSSGECFVY